MKYCILFKHPFNVKRGLKYFSNKKKMYINIEVCADYNTFSIEKTLKLLNDKWNNNKKLYDLQKCGTVFELGTNVENSKTELSKFKKEHKQMKEYVNIDNGDINYLTEDKDGFSTAVLEIPVFANEGLHEILKAAKEYEWNYLFILNEQTKNFDFIEIGN